MSTLLFALCLTENRELADKLQLMDRKREDVRDSFLDMVENENETAIQALETPIEVYKIQAALISPRRVESRAGVKGEGNPSPLISMHEARRRFGFRFVKFFTE